MSERELNGAVGGSLERAGGERKRIADGRVAREGLPDPELVERPVRRRFSAEYKLRVLREADACTRPGEVGALLRREGLYSSLLTECRRARELGVLEALARPRGRRPAHPLEVENAELRRRAERVEAELAKARRVIEMQETSPRFWGSCSSPGARRRTRVPSDDRADRRR